MRVAPADSFRRFGAYSAAVGRLTDEVAITGWSSEALPLLDGQPAAKLRELVNIDVRRESSSFFTGRRLADRAIRMAGPFDDVSMIFDPACGAGDLLLAAARRLPPRRTLNATVRAWGRQLGGTDLRESFVGLAQRRLLLLAASLFPHQTLGVDPARAFPRLRVANGLAQEDSLSQATHVLLNPPFARSLVRGGTRVSLAGVFVEAVLSALPSAASFVAILPDVLRSGSNYRAWRLRMLALAAGRHSRIVSIGRFDPHADVDVFTFALGPDVGTSTRLVWWRPHSGKTVGDLFEVHVGAVVPHRETGSGRSRAYLDVATAPRGREVAVATLPWLRTTARVYSPPFVAVRRTSAAGDPRRLAGTVVKGSRPVAVENHLLVALPKDGSLAKCRALLARLNRASRLSWFDRRIRCRHLTVGGLEGAPW